MMRQRDQDFAVGHAGRGAVAEGHGIGAIGQADVVEHQLDFMLRDDFADRAFDLAEVALGLLDARAGRRPHVQAELAGVDGRERSRGPPTATPARPLATTDREHDEHRCGDAASSTRSSDDVRIAQLFETSLERRVQAAEPAAAAHRAHAASLGRQQIIDHRRHDRPRQQIRSQHGKRHGQRQRREQILGRPVEKQHRHEHDADRQRRDERRPGDLHGPIENRLAQRLSQAQVAVNVLDLHRGVVDQNADGQGQPAQRHHVQRMPQQVQHHDRGQDRQRNRNRHDQRAAPTAQKHQNHGGREQPGDDAFGDHPFDRRGDEQRLVEQQIDPQVCRGRRPESAA